MGHPHRHPFNDASRDIKIAFFLNLTFTLLEIIGGLWTNSLAILSDALHDLGDSVSLGLSWYLEKYATKEKDERFSYGYRRFSLLGGLINTVVLISGSLIIIFEAVPRLFAPEAVHARGMLLFAVVGILINGLAVLRMRGSRKLNVQIVAWHLFEDVLGWLAILLVSIIMLFKDIRILDPLLSMLITLYVLYHVAGSLKKTLGLFLQAVPEEIDISRIEQNIRKIDHVRTTHHTHVWSLDGEHHVLTTHVVIDNQTSREQALEIKNQIRHLVKSMQLAHVTVEFEYEGEEACSMR